MIYEIAGLKVQMEPRFHRLTRQSASYISSGVPVIRVGPGPRDEANSLMESLSQEEREYICCGAAFSRGILEHGRFFLHASAVVCGGEAYLFSAPSGTGKSTHTALWLDLFPESFILNDDKPVLQPRKDGVTVWGTPFAGKTDLQVNRGVPLKAICFLKQGSENQIRRLDETEALARMLNNTWRPNTGCGMERLLDLMQMILAQRPMYEMTCTTQLEAAQLSYKVMKGM